VLVKLLRNLVDDSVRQTLTCFIWHAVDCDLEKIRTSKNAVRAMCGVECKGWRCARSTEVCAIYRGVRDLQRCARSTEVCAIYRGVRDLPGPAIDL
jgi:hypothetical protein